MQVFMFPGQGSQRQGMGEDLFDQVSEFRELEPRINEVLGYSLRELCLHDPDNKLKQTRYTQPCLYMVNALHYLQRKASGGQAPDAVMGHSLGEYNALHAAGAFDLLTGLKLVMRRGELMSQAQNGGMAAVIGLLPHQIIEAFQYRDVAKVDVANFNAPLQTVISGPADEVERAGRVLSEAGAKAVVPLSVSAAFHSRQMFDAAEAFDAFLADVPFEVPNLPVIANVTGRPYPIVEASHIRSYLVRQISHPVQWTRSVRYLLDQGEVSFAELGPGQVLTRLVEQIRAGEPSSRPAVGPLPSVYH